MITVQARTVSNSFEVHDRIGQNVTLSFFFFFIAIIICSSTRASKLQNQLDATLINNIGVK